ncbi:hypothetical protein [Nocardioides pakistanensis]
MGLLLVAALAGLTVATTVRAKVAAWRVFDAAVEEQAQTLFAEIDEYLHPNR